MSGGNHAGKNGSAPRARYRRSTPVLRLRRNVGKVIYFVSLSLDRLRNWQATGDPLVERALVMASEVAEKSVDLDELVAELEGSSFVPPKRSASYQPGPGDHVRISERARPRYQQLYERQLGEDPGFLSDLVVVKVLSSGEVAVQRGRRTPLVARKTHLCPVREDA